MTLRMVIIGLMLTTVVALGLIAYQMSQRPQPGPAKFAQAPVAAPLTVACLV